MSIIKLYRKRILQLLAIINLSVLNCFGQSLNAHFGSQLDEQAYQMAVSTNGDYLLVGNKWDKTGGIKAFIVRCNQNGDTIWTKYKKGRGTSIKQLLNGNIIVSAEGGYGMPNYHDWASYHGGSDYVSFMMDSNGNTIWEKCFGGSKYECPTDMLVCNDGGIIIIGRSESNDGDIQSNNTHGWWVVKIDQNGNIIWEKSFGGGDNSNGPQQIIQLSNGAIAICGYDDGFANGYGDTDAYIIVIDNNGNLLWKKVIGGANYPNQFEPYSDRAFSICQSSDGNILVAIQISGYRQAPLPNGDITEFFGTEFDDKNVFLAKLELNSGNFLEKKTLNINQDITNLSKIIQLSNGSIALIGTSMIKSFTDCCHSQVMLSIIPSLSGQIKSYQFGGNNGGFSALNTGYDQGIDLIEVNNQIVIFGTNNSYNGLNHGGSDMWLFKPSINSTNSIDKLSTLEKKTLIKIVNLIGQEVEFTPNIPLIYIYSDGSTEKVFTVE